MKEKAKEDIDRNVKGVLVRCEGEIDLHRRVTGKQEKSVEVEVAKDHPIWKNSPTGTSAIFPSRT